MKITKKWLKDRDADYELISWFSFQKKSNSLEILKLLIQQRKIDLANWLIVQLMNKKQHIYFSDYVIDVWNRAWNREKEKIQIKILNYGISLIEK